MIVHFTSVHQSNDTRIYYRECKALASAGHKISLIVPDTPPIPDKSINVVSVNYKAKNRLARMLMTTFKIYKECLRWNAEVYHFHDPELIPIGLLLKLKGVKVIYDVHEDVPKDILDKMWIPKKLRYIISKVFEKFENFAAKRFDYIVTVTSSIKERFERIGCRVAVVNNYPILEELFNQSASWEGKENAVCYVGSIRDIRGIYECIDAISKTDTKFYLAGTYAVSNLRDCLMKKTGWQQVIELGQIDRNQVAKVMSKCMAGLVIFYPVANHIDAQPNKMFEYMSAGIPVIASDFPKWKEIIEGNQCGICVNPLDPDSIATAIRWIMEHPVEAKAMGENGRRAVEQKYNWEKEQSQLLDLYRELI